MTGKAAAIFGSTLFLGCAISSGIMSYLHETSLMPFVIMINILIAIMVLSYFIILNQIATNNYGDKKS